MEQLFQQSNARGKFLRKEEIPLRFGMVAEPGIEPEFKV